MKHLDIKEGSSFLLFCFVCTYEIHQTGMLEIAFLVSLESSPGGGVHHLVSWCLDVVQKFLNIE
jgi:hypothetical protein